MSFNETYQIYAPTREHTAADAVKMTKHLSFVKNFAPAEEQESLQVLLKAWEFVMEGKPAPSIESLKPEVKAKKKREVKQDLAKAAKKERWNIHVHLERFGIVDPRSLTQEAFDEDLVKLQIERIQEAWDALPEECKPNQRRVLTVYRRRYMEERNRLQKEYVAENRKSAPAAALRKKAEKRKASQDQREAMKGKKGK